MKPFILSPMRTTMALLALLFTGLQLHAQTLKVYSGQTCITFPAAQVGQMEFSEAGTKLNIMNQAFAVADVDSITTSSAEWTSAAVDVDYAADGKAYVSVSSDVCPYLNVSVSGADVRFVGSESLQTEVDYTLHGSSANGSFYMDGPFKASLTLNNLTLQSTTGAPLTIDCGKRITVHIPTGTVNTLTDAAGGAQKACFFINGHAEFKGEGTLNVVGNTKHAYASDEYTWLKPSFGTLNVTGAVSDGLHVEQYFRMDGGTVNVSGTQGDCIDVSVTKDNTDELNGQALIQGGELHLAVTASDKKGLKTDSLCTLAGGTLYADITGDGSKGLSAGTDLVISQKTSNETKVTMNVAGTTYHKGEPDESKCRGIKVQGTFTFDGGTINMNVTGKKAKGIVVGTFNYISGTTNVVPES